MASNFKNNFVEYDTNSISFFFFNRLTIDVSAAQGILIIDIISIWRLCESPIQYALLVKLADKLYNP